MIRLCLTCCIAVLTVFSFAAGTASADDAAEAKQKLTTIKVWPDTAPGEKGDIGPEKLLEPRGGKPVDRITNVTSPTLTVYPAPADRHNGAAVVICPGGGYSILAWDLEGEEVAHWLNSIGVTGILLKYRVPRRKDRPKHEAPLQDAQRAMSLTRAHAKEWNIDPDRIGILGFSAGGHLAATTSTNYDKRSYDSLDQHDEVSCRPDFTVLIYAAYLLEGDKFAPEIRVTEQTPPAFLVHAGDDRISAANSARYYLALKEAGVKGELHIYASGGHGFGLRPTDQPVSQWPARCAAWMKNQGLLKPSK